MFWLSFSLRMKSCKEVKRQSNEEHSIFNFISLVVMSFGQPWNLHEYLITVLGTSLISLLCNMLHWDLHALILAIPVIQCLPVKRILSPFSTLFGIGQCTTYDVFLLIRVKYSRTKIQNKSIYFFYMK